MKPIHQINRRELLAAGAAVAAVTIVPRHVLGGPKFKPPSEKLNIAGVGIGGMGTRRHPQLCRARTSSRCAMSTSGRWPETPKHFPKAKQHTDFRKMLETQKEIDAVIVRHARPQPCRGLDDGDEDGQARPLPEAADPLRLRGPDDRAKWPRRPGWPRRWATRARPAKRARLICEYIQSGAIGTVREVHAGSNRRPPISPRGIPRPTDTPPRAAGVELGPVARPGPRAAVPPVLPPFRLARLVGFWHRRVGRHRLPPTLGRVQGTEAGPPDQRRGLLVELPGRPGDRQRDGPQVVDHAVAVSGRRRPGGVHASPGGTAG